MVQGRGRGHLRSPCSLLLTRSSRIPVFRRRVCVVATVRDRAAVQDVLLDRAGPAVGHGVTAAAVVVPGREGGQACWWGGGVTWKGAHGPASVIPDRGRASARGLRPGLLRAPQSG